MGAVASFNRHGGNGTVPTYTVKEVDYREVS